MVKLAEVLDVGDLANEVERGYVKRGSHPTLPLDIYTYTRSCQYEGRWNDVTTFCRGLIVDNVTDEVVARPLSKFFNYGEHGVREYAPPLELEPFEVYEKMDGSLAILFHYNEQWRAASKGSFISEQAQWAQKRIDERQQSLYVLSPGVTYCAEAIYPTNRIVVKYTQDDLVFLGAFKADGTEIPFRDVASLWPLGSAVAIHKAPSLEWLLHRTAINLHLNADETVSGTDAEGFVIRFRSGVRCKIKYAEFVRLHRILTGITERDVWRAMAYDALAPFALTTAQMVQSLKCSPEDVAGFAASPEGAMATIVEGTPDEFDEWVKTVSVRLQLDFDALKITGLQLYRAVADSVGTISRGDFAREVQALATSRTLSSCCFALLDKKPIDPLIWKVLYPAASTPFREDDEG